MYSSKYSRDETVHTVIIIVHKDFPTNNFLLSFDSLKRAFEGVKILQANDFSDVS